MRGARAAQGLERRDDECVTRQHREALAVRTVHRGLAAAQGRIVETREIVVDQ